MPEPWVFKIGQFFRREDWHGKVGSGKPPLWHVLKDVKKVQVHFENYLGQHLTYPKYVWIAECGYELKLKSFNLAPMQKAEIKTKKLRCTKCQAVIAKRGY